MGWRCRGQTNAAGLLPGRRRRIRDEGRLDRDGRVSRRLEVGTGRGAGRRPGCGGEAAHRRAHRRQPALATPQPRGVMSDDDILERLTNSQRLVTVMLQASAEDSSAGVGAWNLRDIAAHLAATERECYEPRIRSIASGENPSFDVYTNDDTDFSGIQLESALDEWSASRGRLIAYVRTLDGDRRALTGRHEKKADVPADRYLEIALEHDRNHLRALEQLTGPPTRWRRRPAAGRRPGAGR